MGKGPIGISVVLRPDETAKTEDTVSIATQATANKGIRTMSRSNRYNALLQQHGSIEESLAAEMKRPMPNTLILQRLKRQKLIVKDEIQAWERLLDAMSHGDALGAEALRA